VLRVLTFIILFLGFVIYSSFVYTSGTETQNNPANESAIRGELLYQKHNCTACHQLYGLGGFLGPELTTVISQKGKGESYVKTFLKSGTQRMPDFHLKNQEMNDLVEFLTCVDETAITYK
jgi:nitric oxide reductase subunit C